MDVPNDGIRPFSDAVAPRRHPGDGPNSSFGSCGLFRFDYPGRFGIGVHSGRVNAVRFLGVIHLTMGWIRSSDAMIAVIVAVTIIARCDQAGATGHAQKTHDAADAAASAIRTWPQLGDRFKTYRQCGGGYVADGLADTTETLSSTDRKGFAALFGELGRDPWERDAGVPGRRGGALPAHRRAGRGSEERDGLTVRDVRTRDLCLKGSGRSRKGSRLLPITGTGIRQPRPLQSHGRAFTFRSCSSGSDRVSGSINANRLPSNVLVRPVGDFPAWAFQLSCPGCRARREVSTVEVVRHYGGGHLVAEVVERFSCRRCRSVPASVALVSGGDRIELRGPRQSDLLG
ncbi:MAG: hypothetical protein INR65_05280 [Gluconacetobacter diazotrophicus]|nr:hypothetical protein [Gluconacetobacter diazotrophicus]